MNAKYGFGIAFLALTALSSSQKIEDRAGGWSYTPPKEFSRVEDAKQVAKGNIAFIGPRDHDYAVTILIASISVGKETAKPLGKEAIKQAITDRSVSLVSEGTIHANGNVGYSWRLTRKLSSGPSIGQRQVIFLHDDHGVVMTITAPLETMDTWDKAFFLSLKSFNWNRKEAAADTATPKASRAG